MKNAYEVNFDGIVGPTHNYAGLSYGNLASMSHKAAISNPRQAALQGLTKAKALADLGLKQGFLPPQERPDVEFLKRIGFCGRNDAEILSKAQRSSPALLAAACSASSMWTANAATVSPSADCEDQKIHFTAANLNQKLHRAIESSTTARALKAIFRDSAHFQHHGALPYSDALGDEGAANHTRFCREYADPGIEFFVYGREALSNSESAAAPKRFPARQTREASESVMRLHGLRSEDTVFAQQNPACIDAGAFHNDVVSVGNRNVFFYHELAFENSEGLIRQLNERFEKRCGAEFIAIPVFNRDVPLSDAVRSYLFNSQLISKPGSQSMTLIAPRECQEVDSVKRYLERLIGERKTPIQDFMHFDLRQSMNNGGGPACLRLRVVMTDQELAAANSHALLSDATYKKLVGWVERHYRDRLSAEDLADPKLLEESRTALDELTQIMELGSIYPFQV